MSGKKEDNRGFWNRYSRLYDFEINHTSKAAYVEMYRLMSLRLAKDMDVLELATGTGLISINIAPFVRSIEATDFSPKMIDAAKKKNIPANLRFSVQDAAALPYSENTFDAAIISNALHIMPEPVKVMKNIARVLKPNGVLIAPNFSHGHLNNDAWNLNAKILKLIGFETYSKWTPEEYIAFIEEHGFEVERWQILKAAFPLVYLESHKR